MTNEIQRVNWIDWSKVFAIYLVALGHLLNENGMEGYMHNFIYLFHMPFFFFISGYLFKIKEDNFRPFLKQSFKSLIIPYILLNLIGNAFLSPTWYLSRQWPVEQLFYFLTADGHGEPGPTWFLVCLLWVRLLSFYIVRLSNLSKAIIIIFSILFAYNFPYHLYWRFDSALMALPFFIAGFMLKNKTFNNIFEKGGILFLCITIVSAYFMGDTNVYLRSFGNYSLLYYPCAFSGIFMLISFCSLLNRYNIMIIRTLSSGTILIMALHGIVFLYVKTFLKHLSLDYVLMTTPGKFMLSLIALLFLYYPIIWLQNHYPIVMGGRGKYGRK